jgi:hypothetical protein
VHDCLTNASATQRGIHRALDQLLDENKRLWAQINAMSSDYRRRPRSGSSRRRSSSREKEQQTGLCFYYRIFKAYEEMPILLQLEPGKREQLSVKAACDDGSVSRRIYVIDRSTRISFLVDTGTDVCVYPRNKLPGPANKDDYELFAANGTRIATYGTILVSLDLSL